MAPKFRRGDGRRGSWLQRKVPEAQRPVVAGEIRSHRRERYRTDLHSQIMRRDFDYLKKYHLFYLESYILLRLPERGRFAVLDSGAGLLGISGDIKRALGNRVFVTALNPFMPKLPRIKESGNVDEKAVGGKLRGNGEGAESRFKELVAADKALKHIDEYRVNMIENLTTRRRYDLIVDLSGALHYSNYPDRVLERYAILLKEGGTVITDTDAAEFVRGHFGENSGFAKKKGYFLSFKVLRGAGPRFPIYEIGKVKSGGKA